MARKQSAMGFGLRLLNRFAGADSVDRIGARKPAEKVLFAASKTGFQTIGAAARSFGAIRNLVQPVRLRSGASSDLFDLSPTEEQLLLREAVQRFAGEQLRPAANAADSACQAPVELLTEAAGLGLTTLGIPEELGGAGSERSVLTNALVAEAMAQGDLGLAVACLAPSAVSTALVLWGDPQQQSHYLPAVVGERPPVAALALVEARPLFDPFQLQTRARELPGGGYVLEGMKSMVPQAATAELYIVAAELEGKGPALFIVEPGVAGLSAAPEPAMGLRAAATAALKLEQVKLPATALLGEGRPEAYADCVALARLGWCALAVGCGQAVLDYVTPYVNERQAFGEPISHRQSVAFAVANMAIELEGMRLLTWRAAGLAERGKPFVQATAVARRLCIDKAMQIGSDGVQLLGGHGFVKEHPVERWYRDLRTSGVMEGVVLL
jgi:alkylation response protein AidB-like acyl-CoA dehydrogenase